MRYKPLIDFYLHKIQVMRSFCCTFLFLFTTLFLHAKPASFLLPAGVIPIKILSSGKRIFLVSQDRIFEFKGKKLQPVLELPDLITDAVLQKKNLVIATKSGLTIVETESFTVLPNSFPKEAVNGLSVDAYDRLWVATPFKGCFVQAGDGPFEQKLNTPNIYTIRSSPDSNTWVGTNVGLYKMSGKDFHLTRYAEEGYSGYELPDNYVEKIFVDERSNVWVVMPDHLSFKKNDHFTGEIPSYNYIGQKNNDIQTIISLDKGSYLFITEQGSILLPSSSLKEEHHHHNEVFSESNTAAYQMSNVQLKSPEKLRQEKISFAQRCGNDVYFITAAGAWRTGIKAIR